MADKINVTVGILTFNSGKMLARALESVKDVAEIIVCDGGSTDETLEIAKSYGAIIVQQDPSAAGPTLITDFSAVRNKMLDAATREWFFYIDSDETAELELLADLRRIAETDPPECAFRISPRIIYRGRKVEHSSNYPGWQMRVMRVRPDIRFRRPVHERIDLPADCVCGTLQGHWNYYVSGPEAWSEDLARDVPKLLVRYRGKPWWWRLLAAKNSLRTIGAVSVKAAWNSVAHPHDSLPLEAELARVHVQSVIFFSVLGIIRKYDK